MDSEAPKVLRAPLARPLGAIFGVLGFAFYPLGGAHAMIAGIVTMFAYMALLSIAGTLYEIRRRLSNHKYRLVVRDAAGPLLFELLLASGVYALIRRW